MSDIVDGALAPVDHVQAAPAGCVPVDVGGSRTTRLIVLVRLRGDALEVEPRIEWHPPQPGDVRRTFADIRRAGELPGYRPAIGIEEGLHRFVRWYREGEPR